MIRIILMAALMAFTSSAFAQDHDHDGHHDNHDHQGQHHDTNHGADHSSNHSGDHEGHDHDNSHDASHNGDHAQHQKEENTDAATVLLSRTPEIDTALAAGGEPVVVEVLGVVCDFCAKAMNKTFGKKEEVAAVYVDLDHKILNLVLTADNTMDDEAIKKAVKRSGYKTKEIHRGTALLGNN